MSIVAVTGANGFIASWIVDALLRDGYTVHACVRDVDNPLKVDHLKAREKLHNNGKLVFFTGDLFKEGSYDAAFRDADIVMHTAAVVEIGSVKNPQKQIVDPSVKGLANVLRSVEKCPGIRQYIHTSSVAAVHNMNDSRRYSEKDWCTYSRLSNDAYGFAKTKAEKGVWKWAEEHRDVEISVLNPSVVLGDVMTKAHTKASTYFTREALYNNALPPVHMSFVDVKDVAQAHLSCIGNESAYHERFIVSNDEGITYAPDLGKIAQKEIPEWRLNTPPKYGPLLLLLIMLLSYLPIIGSYVMGSYDRDAIGARVSYDNRKSKKALGIKYRLLKDTLKSGIQSVVDGGFVKPKIRRK